MIADASALLAILFQEPEAAYFSSLLLEAEEPRISAVNFLEVAIRIDAQNNVASTQAFESFLAYAGIVVEPVSLSQLKLARLAYIQFGKGRHPASLNLGDVFAYALAKERGEPLLFKGDDFGQTDVQKVVF